MGLLCVSRAAIIPSCQRPERAFLNDSTWSSGGFGRAALGWHLCWSARGKQHGRDDASKTAHARAASSCDSRLEGVPPETFSCFPALGTFHVALVGRRLHRGLYLFFSPDWGFLIGAELRGGRFLLFLGVPRGGHIYRRNSNHWEWMLASQAGRQAASQPGSQRASERANERAAETGERLGHRWRHYYGNCRFLGPSQLFPRLLLGLLLRPR